MQEGNKQQCDYQIPVTPQKFLRSLSARTGNAQKQFLNYWQ